MLPVRFSALAMNALLESDETKTEKDHYHNNIIYYCGYDVCDIKMYFIGFARHRCAAVKLNRLVCIASLLRLIILIILPHARPVCL